MRDFSILDDLEEGVQIIDSDLRYVYLNRTLLKEVQFKKEEIIGFKMVERFPNIDRTDIYAEIVRCLKNQCSTQVLNEFKFSDGRQVFYEVKIQPITEGLILFTRDITATKKGEILLKESNKNLEHFAHLAAHDMREPVRRIEILSEELLLDHQNSLSGEAKEICARLNHQSHALMSLINDFRDLSGLGRGILERETFSLKVLARELVQDLFQKEEFKVHLLQDDVQVSGYPSLVRVLLKNLLENAFQHGDGEVKIDIEKSDDEIMIVVSNLTSKTLTEENIFLPFSKGSQSRGTGLGLAIAKKVVDRHDGKIWSKLDGRIFSVIFTLES